MKSICVFCGSSTGSNSKYVAAARQLGELIAQKKLRLVDQPKIPERSIEISYENTFALKKMQRCLEYFKNQTTPFEQSPHYVIQRTMA